MEHNYLDCIVFFMAGVIETACAFVVFWKRIRKWDIFK